MERRDNRMKREQNTLNKLLGKTELYTIIGIILMLLFNLFFTKGFFDIQIRDGHLYGSLIDIIKRGTPLMITVMGLTMVIATGGTDISVGSIAAITGVVVGTLIGGNYSFDVGVENTANMPMGLAIMIGLLVALILGTWNGFMVAKIGIPPLIATLMLQVAGRGIAELIASGTILTIYYKPFHFIGSGWILGLPFSVFIVILIGLLIGLFVRKTAFGLFLVSTGSNRTATRFAGIRTTLIVWSAYVFSAVMAGVAGIITTSEIKAADPVNLGLYLELDAILACNLGGNSMKGGRCNLLGSILGAILVQILTTTIYFKGVPSETILVYKAGVVIIIGLIQVTKWSKILEKLKGGMKREVA